MEFFLLRAFYTTAPRPLRLFAKKGELCERVTPRHTAGLTNMEVEEFVLSRVSYTRPWPTARLPFLAQG